MISLLIIIYALFKQMSSLQLMASGTSESTNNSSSQTPNSKAPIWEYYEHG
jgi:hypothetical protein